MTWVLNTTWNCDFHFGILVIFWWSCLMCVILNLTGDARGSEDQQQDCDKFHAWTLQVFLLSSDWKLDYDKSHIWYLGSPKCLEWWLRWCQGLKSYKFAMILMNLSIWWSDVLPLILFNHSFRDDPKTRQEFLTLVKEHWLKFAFIKDAIECLDTKDDLQLGLSWKSETFL